MIHIYEGDGKGKTTAAYGLCLRASGYGKNIVIGAFLKPDSTGEFRAVSESLRNTSLFSFGGCYGFFGCMSKENEKKCIEEIRNGFFKIISLPCDLLIMDEIIDIVNFGIISEEELISEIKGSPAREIVLTGRNPSEKLISLADYYTHFEKIKHPFDKGLDAREGIEY